MRTNLTFAFDLYELAPPASVWRIHTAVGELDRRYSSALLPVSGSIKIRVLVRIKENFWQLTVS